MNRFQVALGIALLASTFACSAETVPEDPNAGLGLGEWAVPPAPTTGEPTEWIVPPDTQNEDDGQPRASATQADAGEGGAMRGAVDRRPLER